MVLPKSQVRRKDMDEALEAATALSVAVAKKEKTEEKVWLVGLRGSTRYGSKLVSQAVSVKQGVVPNIIMTLPNPPRFQVRHCLP